MHIRVKVIIGTGEVELYLPMSQLVIIVDGDNGYVVLGDTKCPLVSGELKRVLDIISDLDGRGL